MLKKVGVVAGPIAIQSLIASSLNLVDNLMVGGLGELALNAVGVSVQIYFVYWMLIFGFCSGGATFMSQFFGTKDYTNIRRTAGFAFSVTFCIGIIFFLAATFFPEYILRVFTKYPEVIEAGVPYVRTGAPCFLFVAAIQPLALVLRTTQQTEKPLYASVIALCTNTFLNYSLIYGHFGLPELGIRGAAMATVVARIIETTILVFFIFIKKNPMKGPLKEYFSYGSELARRVVRNSLPTTINETMWGLGTSLYVAAFARISITAGAAIQACNTINSLFCMCCFSIGDAVLIMVGQKIGEGELEYAYGMTKNLIKLGLIIGAVMGGLTILFGKPILSLFEFTPEGAHSAWLILIVYGCTMWLDAYGGIMVSGVLRCGGDTRFAMFTEVGTVWLIGVPLAFITSLKLGWPIYLAVLAVRGESLVKGIILTGRYKSRKWLRNVIQGL
ncbi:MAG: MATE family efflux transporter [Clostridia bacterium]|nr:MATE family efflux transporter [Clostridia bacterium]